MVYFASSKGAETRVSWRKSSLVIFPMLNPRRCIAGQTGVETAIATARPFLGVRASSLGLQKALGALYNFAAGCQVVGCKPGPQPADEVGNHTLLPLGTNKSAFLRSEAPKQRSGSGGMDPGSTI